MIPLRTTVLCLALALFPAWAGHGLAFQKGPEAFLGRARQAVLAAPGLEAGIRSLWLGRGLKHLHKALAGGMPRDLALDIFQTALDQGWQPKELEAIYLRLLRSGTDGADLRRLALVLLWRRMRGLPLPGADPVPRAGGKAVSSRRFVETLKRWLGTPYRFGGKQAGAVDCSGFVRAVYAANGVELPDGSWNQARAGLSVDNRPLRLGDILVFKKTDGQVSHVGIYLGHKHFVHSLGGQGVVISTLNEPRFKRMYAGARRVARFRGRADLDSWYLFS